MDQTINERVAVNERLIKGLNDKMQGHDDKLDRVIHNVATLSNRNILLESKVDTFISHIDSKVESIIKSQELFNSQFKEKQIIDKTQLAYEEEQKRKTMKFWAAVGTLVLACVSNIDKIQAVFAKNEPVTVIHQVEPTQG